MIILINDYEKKKNLNPIKSKKKKAQPIYKTGNIIKIIKKNSKPHNHALSSDTPSHNSYTIQPLSSSSSAADRPKKRITFLILLVN